MRKRIIQALILIASITWLITGAAYPLEPLIVVLLVFVQDFETASN